MKNNNIKYFIYARKSTESDGRQVLSIPAQTDEAVKIQTREQLVVVDMFTDSGSAKIPFNRKAYTDMIRRIKKGEASGIIVWKIDRLARNHLEGGELIHLLQTGIIKSIHTPGREYLSSDSALLISLEASMASQYSVDLSENVTRGLYKKVEIGQPPIIAPMGYLNTKLIESGTNSILVDAKRWSLMRKAFDLMLTKQYTIAKVASILNNEYNFRTRTSKKRNGARMSTSVLHRALTNPFYTGHFLYGGKLHKGTYKAMITMEEFDLVQAILGRSLTAAPQKHEFAFTGFIICGCCGCAVTASKKLKKIKSTGEYKTYTFYHCTKRKGFALCGDKEYTTEKEMVALIEDEIEKLSITPLWKKWVFDSLKEDYEDELIKQKDLLSKTKIYEQKILSELNTILDLRISNNISADQYNHKKAERELELIRVKERSSRLETNIDAWINEVKEKLDFAENVSEKFKSGDSKLQKAICYYIGWNWILKGKKLTFTRHEWFNDVENLKSFYDEKKQPLELIKTFIEFKETAFFKAIRPILSSLRDSIRIGNNKKTIRH